LVGPWDERVFLTEQHQRQQQITIQKTSNFDVKDLVVECAFVGTDGTAISTNDALFFGVYRAGERDIVSLQETPYVPNATDMACITKDFVYIGVRASPRPERASTPSDSSSSTIVDAGTGRPVGDERPPQKALLTNISNTVSATRPVKSANP
jgi:hypothetical protein